MYTVHDFERPERFGTCWGRNYNYTVLLVVGTFSCGNITILSSVLDILNDKSIQDIWNGMSV